MRIKRIKILRVNSFIFTIKWNSKLYNSNFSYKKRTIEFGTKGDELLTSICHELMELVALEMNVRLNRPDCNTDYIFVYDHRQHETMTNMFAGLLIQFLE